MRGFDCGADDHHHDGEDDAALFREVRRHADEVHAGQFTDEQIRGFVAAGAYECEEHGTTTAAGRAT